MLDLLLFCSNVLYVKEITRRQRKLESRSRIEKTQYRRHDSVPALDARYTRSPCIMTTASFPTANLKYVLLQPPEFRSPSLWKHEILLGKKQSLSIEASPLHFPTRYEPLLDLSPSPSNLGDRHRLAVKTFIVPVTSCQVPDLGESAIVT